MIFDPKSEAAYMALSNRAHLELAHHVCKQLHYELIPFEALDTNNQAIYHTNVMMWIGNQVAMVCFDSIRDSQKAQLIKRRLESSGRLVLSLSQQQVRSFAGNMQELTTFSAINGDPSSHLLLSSTAHKSLSLEEIERLEQYVQLKTVSIPTIEMAGGSIRCMLATIHLPALV